MRSRLPVFVVLAAVAGLLAWRFSAGRAASAPMTAGDVLKLEERYRRSGAEDSEKALAVLQGYTAVITLIGDLSKAVRVTQDMLARDPNFASQPRVRASADKMNREWEALLRKTGIQGPRGWNEFLRRGIEFSDSLLVRGSLSDQQKAAALVCRGKILFQAQRFDETMADASESLRLDQSGVLAHLVRADVCSERMQYSAAVQEMRAASMKLDAWSEQPPSWEMRIALVMMQPRRAALRERRWRERRRGVAELLRSQLQSEISVLQGLERVQMRAR